MGTLQTQARFGRSVASSPLPQRWSSETEEVSPEIAYVELATQFLQAHNAFKEAAKKNVYENADLNEKDIRMHIYYSTGLTADGQYAQLFFLRHQVDILEAGQATELFKIVDQSIQDLIDTIHEWHGSPGTHKNEPESFRKAMEEYKSGKAEEWS